MIGVDIVFVPRIIAAIKKPHFLERIFTAHELEYAADKPQSLAGIFAAKEAVSKVSGRGMRGYFFSDIEIVHTADGCPKVQLSERAAQFFHGNVYVSISHDGDYAIAVAVYEKEQLTPIVINEAIEGSIPVLKRSRFSHKGDYGRVFVIGGSPNYIGAPLFTAKSAFKSGGGLVTLCPPLSMSFAYSQRIDDVMLSPLSDDNGFITSKDILNATKNADIITIGNGMGDNPYLADILYILSHEYSGTLIIDADALNALAKDAASCIIGHKSKIILTPHIGESNRLKIATGAKDAADLASKLECVVVEKSAFTLITDGFRKATVTAGTAALAKGGSGDVLAGIIAAAAVRLDIYNAAVFGSYHLGKTAEFCERKFGAEHLTPQLLIDNLCFEKSLD